MSQLFNKIKVSSDNRNSFDLSHHQVTTSDFGFLIPVCYRDMVPNDDFVVTPEIFCRLSPMALPTYGSVKCRVHHFFVPYRILYKKWDSFITQDVTNHTVPPFFTAASLRLALASDPAFSGQSGLTLPRGVYSRLMSNLGLNPALIQNTEGFASTDRFSGFPFMAYYRIWLDYFCDSSLNNYSELLSAFNDAADYGGSLANFSNFLLTRNVCYKKDYFTTAKLNPQDGNPSIVGVDIASPELNPGIHFTTNEAILRSTGSVVGQDNGGVIASGSTSKIGQFTVEALRAANSLQRYLERNNFVGTKVINRILAHFGITPSAERLDMAEFLGGSSFPIRIGDVTSTSSSDGTTEGVGFKAGQGVGAGSLSPVRYHAKEHGIFMSVMSLLPDTGYYQGVSRFWQKGVYGDALDYFHPEFENLGYQEILNKEVYVPSNDDQYQNYERDGVFGYTPRYSEYKFQNDILAGDFVASRGQSTVGADYDSYHLFRKLRYDDDNPLALNNNFVELDNHNNDYDRIFQFTSNDFDHFIFNINFDVKATRPMAGFGEPSLSANNEGEGNTMDLPYGGTRL